MSFSASTCLTYTGNTPLGATLYFYTDFDGYSEPPFGSVATNLIIGGNCPYIITGIPDGTTIIRLKDYSSGCCVDIPIQSSDLCLVCNLEFNLLSATTVSQIVAGDLLTTCEDQVSDYVVYWYGPNSSTNVGYISGYGDEFDYQFEHPLTGTSAIFAQAGTYTPVIDKIISNGVTFSQTGGTGYYMANLDCFSSVTVNPLTCDNGNQPTSAYTHFYSFSGASQGVESPPLQATFQLSAGTNYFAWKIRGFSVPDTFTFSYSGTNYPVPLVLDRVIIGDNLQGSNMTWTNFTKSADTSIDLQRVICLTGLTRSPGNESIIIDLTPNSGLTNWELSVTCLDFDCYKCIDDLTNQSYKIFLSGVTALTYDNSDQLVSDFSASCYTRVFYNLSGCAVSDYFTTDYYKYFQQNVPGVTNVDNYAFGSGNAEPYMIPLQGAKFGNGISEKLFFNGSNCNRSGVFSPAIISQTCAVSDNTSTIFYQKYISGTCPSCVGVVYMEFNQYDDMSHYITTYETALQSSSSWYYSACTTVSEGPLSGTTTGETFTGSVGVNGPFSGGTSINSIPSYLDNQDYRYYRYLWLAIPCQTGSTNCGQSSEGGVGCFSSNYIGLQGIAVHPSANVTTGITGSNYYIQIILNTISYGANFSPCAIDCTGTSATGGFRFAVNTVNSNSTGTSTNFSAITNTGSYYTNPWNQRTIKYMDCESVSGSTNSGFFNYITWSNNTLPFSSSTSPLYSLSAQTCTPVGQSFTNFYRQYLFNCSTKLLNTGSTDFQIWCYSITNGNLDTLTLALTYSGGSFTYTDPNFVIT
jgi:hypothetical protein